MQKYEKAHGLTEFVSMQNFHNATYREEQREMTPLLQDLGVGMIPWSPFARGFLVRPLQIKLRPGARVTSQFLTHPIYASLTIARLNRGYKRATRNVSFFG